MGANMSKKTFILPILITTIFSLTFCSKKTDTEKEILRPVRYIQQNLTFAPAQTSSLSIIIEYPAGGFSFFNLVAVAGCDKHYRQYNYGNHTQ